MLAGPVYKLIPNGTDVENGSPSKDDASDATEGDQSFQMQQRQIDQEVTVSDSPTIASTKHQQANRNARMVALLGLVIVDSAIILTMKKASMTRAGDGKNAITTTIVIMSEILKVTACCVEIMVRRRLDGGLLAEVREEILAKPRETLMLLVPAVLYLVQNNLSLIAIANLEAVVQQNVSQLKILTTAVFSTIVLKRKLSVQQWSALVILTAGCAVVQTGGPSANVRTARPGTSPTLGLICCLCVTCTSGLAGVYCEKMLKSGSSNMAIRNIQLGVPALILGVGAALISDGQRLSTDGFFQGYTIFTWLVILLGSGGGLLVTVIMKYGDNIVKTIAVAVSLVVSATASIYLFDFIPTMQFIAGSSLVVLATFLYSNLVSVCAPR